MRENAPPKQLAFDLPLDPRYGREDFLVGTANEAAYTSIEAWPDWPDTVLVTDDDTVESLHERIKVAERDLLVATTHRLANHRWHVLDRKVLWP